MDVAAQVPDRLTVLEPADVARHAANLHVGVFQPSVPRYRRSFFELLASRLGELTVCAGGLQRAAGFDAGAALRGCTHRLVTHCRLGPLLWMPAMLSEVDARRFDVLIYSWNSRYVHLLPGILRCRRRGVGSVAWGHGYSKTERPWRRELRERIGRIADVVMTYNQSSAEQLCRRGFDSGRVFVAPNALDQGAIDLARRRWLDRPVELERFQREHDLLGRPVALYVSRLVASRGMTTLLGAWRSVLQALPGARLVLIGDGPARGAIESAARDAGLAESVRFLGAIYDEEQLAPWFLSAWCMPFAEKIGLSLHHAFGYGVPIVTFNTPTTHGPEFESLEDGVNGFAVPSGDEAAFAAKIIATLSDRDLARRLGAAARERVLTRHTLACMADGFVRAIVAARRSADERRGASGKA